MTVTLYRMITIAILGNFLFSFDTKPIFAQKNTSIRSVDFYNFSYVIDVSNKIVLHKGLSREEPLPRMFSEERLVLLRYVDFDADGKEEAVIAIRDLEPGSGPLRMDYFVYDFYQGSPRQIFHESQQGPKGLCINGRSLIITAAAWADDRVHQPHCCPEYTERKVYQLRDTGFVVKSRRRWKNYPFQHPQIYKGLSRCR